jgi:hypothetical protein
MSITFLFREAGIAAAQGRRGLARPAVLWNPGIEAGLKTCKNLVNVAAINKAIFQFPFVRVSPEGFSTTEEWFRISFYFLGALSILRAANRVRIFRGSANFS